jgi:hypothetical protein
MRLIGRLLPLLAAALLACGVGDAEAQYNGSNLLGDFGVLSGTQPEPGFYLSTMYYNYGIDRVVDGAGDPLDFLPSDDPASLSLHAFAPIVWWVTGKKVLGANFGVMAAFPLGNAALEVPALGFRGATRLGFGDIYLRPVDLGWHTERADYTAGFAVTMPTGRYDDPEDADVGLGMWSYEVFAGGSFYLDAARNWNVATTAYWETHSTKKDSDVKVGDLLTLEGGAARSFKGGAINVGAAYYAQWKLTQDEFGEDVLPSLASAIGKHRVYGIGPDVTVPLASSTRLWALVNVRYLWEVGTRTKTEGQPLVVTITWPIPSIPIS